MSDSQKTRDLSLFPKSDIESTVLQVQVPDLYRLVETVNKTVHGITDIEALKRRLSVSFSNFTDTTKDYYDNISSGKDTIMSKEDFINYVNGVFQLLDVRKVYNTSPRISFTDFNNSSCNDKFLNLVIPKSQDLPFLDITTGGSCHNYSLIFKEFFDKVGVESTIVFCNPVSNHSFLLVNLFGEYYVVDPLFNQKQFMRKLNIGDEIQIGFSYYGKVKSIDPFYVEYHQEGNEDNFNYAILGKIDSPELFANQLDQRKIKYIIVENYIKRLNSPFRLYVGKESGDNFHVSISLFGNEVEYLINFKKISKLFKGVDINTLSNSEIILRLVEYVYSLRGKNQPIALSDIKDCTSEISTMIKREDLLSLLNIT